MMRLTQIFIIVSGVLLLLTFAWIRMSAFLPAKPEAKALVVRSEFRDISEGIKFYFSENPLALPRSWNDLKEYHVSVFSDPFAGNNKEYQVSFREDYILIWSVGKNGKNDMQVNNNKAVFNDELVLYCDLIEGDLIISLYGAEIPATPYTEHEFVDWKDTNQIELDE